MSKIGRFMYSIYEVKLLTATIIQKFGNLNRIARFVIDEPYGEQRERASQSEVPLKLC